MDVISILLIIAAAAMGAGYRQVKIRRPDWQQPARIALLLGFSALLAVIVVRSCEDNLFGDDSSLGREVDSGRIERADEGFAITFPEHWMVQEVSPTISDEVTSGREAAGRMTILLASTDAEDRSGCIVADVAPMMREAGWVSVVAIAMDTVDSMAGVPRWTDASGDIVQLPAGRAGRIESVDADGEHLTQLRPQRR